MGFTYKDPTNLKVKNNRKSVAMATAVGKCFLNQITSSSCNEHTLKVLNNVKCPQNKRPRNRKIVAMKTLVAEIAKNAITYKFSCH